VPNQSAPLDHARVRAALEGTRFSDVRYVSETGSTNADAQALLGQPAAAGATIVAEFQSAGSGRKGRRWFAPPGSALLFTAILPDPIPVTQLWAVPFWIALGVAGTIERLGGPWLDLVWPNDLYLNGGKVGGILSVTRIVGDQAWVGCGVGLNIVRPDDPGELASVAPPPSFIGDVKALAREDVLAAILNRFNVTLTALADPAAISMAWQARAALPGTIYRYTRDADGIEREGLALKLNEVGALVVRDADGERAIDMADVRVVGHTL
jgi:BirA family biotin operon repressor/biotin-[acetyl-CoA-carboxylase] ligase